MSLISDLDLSSSSIPTVSILSQIATRLYFALNSRINIHLHVLLAPENAASTTHSLAIGSSGKSYESFTSSARGSVA